MTRSAAAVDAITKIVSRNATQIMTFLSVITFAVISGRPEAETLFVSIALFRQLSKPVSVMLPWAVAVIGDSTIAAKNVQELLDTDDKSDRESSVEAKLPTGSVQFTSYSARWSRSQEHDTLRDLNLSVTPGQLIVVVGAVGSGKTCLLNAILGELEVTSGHVVASGRVSYAPQESWCFSATVRDNILLGADE